MGIDMLGEYFGDKIHGFGVYHFANGRCYEGSWHEGRKQGYGMYSFRNRDTRCGEWDCGNLKMPLPPLTDAVLRAVQLLAVKKLDTTSCRKQSNEDFLELVFSVSKLKHANVVELVGYCAEHGQQLLVFLGRLWSRFSISYIECIEDFPDGVID